MSIGETRGNINGRAEEQRSGANRKSAPRHRRRTKAPGRTGVRTVGGARDQRRFGVTRRFSLTKPEGERTGATREGSSTGAGRCSTGETRALVVGDTEAPLYGATRKRTLGTAEAFNPRVASGVDRRQKPEGAGRGETRGLHHRHRESRGEPGQPGTSQTSDAEGCEIRVASKIHRRSRPKDRASG